MYTVEYTDGGIHILFDGEPAMLSIVPVLTLDDGSTSMPALTGHSRTGNDNPRGPVAVDRFSYEDKAIGVTLSLDFQQYAETVVASATINSLREHVIGARAKGLAAFGGLRLEVEGLGVVDGLMANYLHKDWWSRPHFDTQVGALPPRTQSVVWHTEAAYHHLLCVCDATTKTELSGDGKHLLVLTGTYAGGYCNLQTTIFVLSSGEDPFDLPERNVRVGMRVLGTPFQTREDKRYPEPFEYLGWCSWDAFRHQVSAAGIRAKAREFHDKEIPVRWMIIDDGWMADTNRALAAFEPDPVKFPEGLAPLVSEIKESGEETQAGIWWIGIWHTLFGYWNGIYGDSDMARSMGDALTTTHNGKVIPSGDPSRAFKFWDAWHTSLRNAGIDFVKVDHQSGLWTFWQQEMAVGAAAQRVHNALEASVGKNFDNAMINCMGMATENLWHRPTSAVTRSSDDFFPDQRDSFVEHVMQNAYNAYYHAPFMWLDWDMWWTQHEHAATHAILRAVSGGPVYVSDRLDKTDPAQLWPLILSDGRLLRCDQPAMVTEDCLLRDPRCNPVPLKLWNLVGDAGIIVALNVADGDVTVRGTVGPGDVPGLSGERYVVYEHFSKVAKVLDGDDSLALTLAPGKDALYAVVPLSNGVTPIGLVDKYISPAAVADWTTTGDRTTVVLLDGGVFAWAAAAPPAEVRVNGQIAHVEVGDGAYFVDCTGAQGSVWIEILAEAGAAS